ncbi:hypothetical protein QBZ16_000313 [Prototheca wickerhamii]|uniref:PHD-type domain-containing protein n=1 Tax=Prototheca wickerhamii TaxID=3111 RepID=A0AAD9MLZ9_PROWI|nr:hypothetical protein QBZ16_000313 [Prototheca wickerhamii]
MVRLRLLWASVSELPVTSALCRQVAGAVGQAEAWVERCRRAVVKRSADATLGEALEVIGATIDNAVAQFERQLEVEKKLVAAAEERRGEQAGAVTGDEEADAAQASAPPSPTRAAAAAAGDDSGTLYCLCQRPYEPGANMISCDSCGEWFHMRCVGVSLAQSKSLREYCCPVCAAVAGREGAGLAAALARLRRTKRPSRAALGALLEQARALAAAAEEAALELALVKFDRWATAAARAMEVHEASRRLEGGERMLPLSAGMLLQLLRSAASLEIDAGAVAERILSLLRGNAWREDVEAAFAAGARPEAQVAEALRDRAVALGIRPESDVVGCRLAAALRAFEAWKARADQALAVLTAAASSDEQVRAASAAAAALVREAQALAIAPTGDVDLLKERSTLYCLCQRPYDEQRPLLGCDHCSNWYHYECVGLRSPGESGAGDEPDDFRCPLCCRRAGVAFDFALPPGSDERVARLAEGSKAAGEGEQAGRGKQASHPVHPETAGPGAVPSPRKRQRLGSH